MDHESATFLLKAHGEELQKEAAAQLKALDAVGNDATELRRIARELVGFMQGYGRSMVNHRLLDAGPEDLPQA